MPALTLRSWIREFRRDAQADKLALMREHLRRLDLQATPEMLLEGTIAVVHACTAYLTLDRQSVASFLAMQTYDPARSPDARYAFTFDVCDKAVARVLIADTLGGLDLADLYGHPLDQYKVCGFSHIWITRTDWVPLTSQELVRLEQEVTEDLRFDYSEDELCVWFDDIHTPGSLFVTVQDREGYNE